MPPRAKPAPVSPRFYRRRDLALRVAKEYEAILGRGRSAVLRPRLARSLALANLRPGLRLVDVGCGRGEAAMRAAQRGAEVIALDFSRDAITLSQETASACLVGCQQLARDRLWLAAAEATALPLADQVADRVLLLDLLEHLHPWQVDAALREVRRILRPGGYVVIHTLPNRWALALAYPWLRLLVPALPQSPRSAYERQVHVNEQDPLRLRRALRQAGLRSRVWVEEWTSRHAQRGCGAVGDDLQTVGYAWLKRPEVRRVLGLLMATPLRWLVANDLFALAWLPGSDPPPAHGRYRAVH